MVNTCKQRIYYYDTDKGGVVYYANYLKYFEVGRTEYIKEIGYDTGLMENRDKIISPVIDIHVKYYKSARYNDEIIIKTKLEKLSYVKIHFSYEIYNQKNELLVTGSSINGFIDINNSKPKKLPKEVFEMFNNSI